jgi:hypothetical protein
MISIVPNIIETLEAYSSKSIKDSILWSDLMRLVTVSFSVDKSTRRFLMLFCNIRMLLTLFSSCSERHPAIQPHNAAREASQRLARSSIL